MSDIIANAKRLIENATPGPWKWESRVWKGDFECSHDWLGGEHGTALETTDSDEYASWVEASDSDKELIAAAPELAKTVIEQAEEIERLKAEETYEYQVQARSKKRPAWKAATNDGLQEWYAAEDIEIAKWKAMNYTPSFGDGDIETRVLRRRVSQPEVME